MINLYQAIYKALMLNDPLLKCDAVHQIFQQWQNKPRHFSIDVNEKVKRIPDPGRPMLPELVSPKSLPKRSLHTEEGRLVLMHAIAHIEFNAINLALDAAYRFQNQPRDFYTDWLKVADDEARHFALILHYLRERDSDYGAYTAHNGLWEMVLKTDHNIVHRMALVPRVLEARGLDVSPAMIAKLKQAGDNAAADILHVIYHDEISHVEAGSRWFKYYCAQQKLEPESTFMALIDEYLNGQLKGPFNADARIEAGFAYSEIESLKQLKP